VVGDDGKPTPGSDDFLMNYQMRPGCAAHLVSPSLDKYPPAFYPRAQRASLLYGSLRERSDNSFC
jgi:hypothetical protein